MRHIFHHEIQVSVFFQLIFFKVPTWQQVCASVSFVLKSQVNVYIFH